MEEYGCMVLPYHEVESYLCYPKLIVAVARLRGKSLSLEIATEHLVERCKKLFPKVAMRRTIANAEIRLRVGTAEGPWPIGHDEAKNALKNWARKEANQANNYENSVCEIFEVEWSKCESAINEKNVDDLLILFPGKEIIAAMSGLAGFGPREQLQASVVWNLEPNDYPRLVEIREKVLANLS